MTRLLVGLAPLVSLSRSVLESDNINGDHAFHWQHHSSQAKISISRARRSMIQLVLDTTAVQLPKNLRGSTRLPKSVAMLLRSSLSGVSDLPF